MTNKDATFKGTKPQNIPEGIFYSFINSKSDTKCTKRGWCDFAAFTKDGQFYCVEVKPEKEDLRESQYDIALALSKYGIPCFKFTIQNGFKIIGSTTESNLELANNLNKEFKEWKKNPNAS